MATGIPSKKQNNNKIPITLMYEGKKDKDSIIYNDGVEFKKVASVNGDSDNSLFYGDNLYVLLYLLNNGYRGKIKLIYIDPPFATVSNFVNKNQELAYCDPLNGGAYVEFLRERIIVMNELLSDDGSIYIHLDNNMAFTIKLVMDEIFELAFSEQVGVEYRAASFDIAKVLVSPQADWSVILFGQC